MRKHDHRTPQIVEHRCILYRLDKVDTTMPISLSTDALQLLPQVEQLVSCCPGGHPDMHEKTRVRSANFNT